MTIIARIFTPHNTFRPGPPPVADAGIVVAILSGEA
jgi:hypothetical protein